jgi:hypothetical protein
VPDEEDERPRKRQSRSADADEDFDRDDPGPRRSKKEQKKGSGMLLWLGLGGGAVLLLGMGICAGVLYFVWGRGLFGPRLTTEMKYLPDNCVMVSTVRIDQMRKTRLYEAQKAKFKGLSGAGNLHGLKEEDVERVTTSNQTIGQGGVSIITTIKAVKAEEVKAGMEAPLKNLGGVGLKRGFAEEKVGSYVLYKLDAGLMARAFCVPESKIVLVGAADELRKILQRDKKPEFSEGFQRAWSDADFSATWVVIIATITGGKPGGDKMAGGAQLPAATLTQLDYGTTVKVIIVSYYKDADDAEEGRKQVVEKLEKRGVTTLGLGTESNKELKQNASVSRSGSKVTLTSSVKDQTMIDDFNRR